MALPAFMVLRSAGGTARAFVIVLSAALVFDRLAAAARTFRLRAR